MSYLCHVEMSPKNIVNALGICNVGRAVIRRGYEYVHASMVVKPSRERKPTAFDIFLDMSE